MELEPGFKLSEAGPIPEDWEAARLGDVCPVILDGPHYTPAFVDEGVPFYAGENVVQKDFKGRLRISRDEYVALCRRLTPQRGDVLLVWVGEIGHTAVVDWDHPFHIYVNVAVLRAGPRLSPSYLGAVSQGAQFQKELMDRALLHAVPKKINLSSIADIRFALTSGSEQESITRALESFDRYLQEALAEQEKLELVQRAAIDVLVSGEVRLPGFSKPWTRQQLGAVCQIKKGQQLGRSSLHKATGFPVWNGGTSPSGYYHLFNATGPACIISEGGNSCGTVSWVETDFWCGGHCYIVRPLDKELIHRFVYYVTKHSENEIKSLKVGSGLPNIQSERLADFEISFPIDVAEQNAIAEVLSDIDAALSAARAVVAKARAARAAAADALLSGRVRLPPFGRVQRQATADALEAA